MEMFDVLYSVLRPKGEFVSTVTIEAESMADACGIAQSWVSRMIARDGVNRNLIAMGPAGSLDRAAEETNLKLLKLHMKPSDADLGMLDSYQIQLDV